MEASISVRGPRQPWGLFILVVIFAFYFLSINGCTDVVVPESKPEVIEELKTEIGLAWDSKPDGKQWSEVLKASIETNWDKLSAASDMNQLCSKYNSLNDADKKIAWAEMFVAIAFYESSWNTLSRYNETTMGNDEVTGLPAYSEGLFQLSYQDEQWIKCGFDWKKDKNLSPTSSDKTTLNPQLNIDCAVRIMARQVTKYGEVLLSKNVYWAVIKEGGRYQKIQPINGRIESAFAKCKGA